MNQTEIKQFIKENLALLIGETKENIKDDDFFVKDIGADSISIVQLYLTCQEKYNVPLAEELNLAEPMTVSMLTERIIKIRSDENEDRI